MSDVTQILGQIESGNGQAAEKLLPLVYDELRKLAAVKMSQENPGQTLQATALVHEAYIRLVDTEKAQHWNSRVHFFGAAAEAMRRILIERARRKHTLKAGGDRHRVDIDLAHLTDSPRPEKLLVLDEAITQLELLDPPKAQLVKLRYFVGMTNKDAAKALEISTTTADRYWVYARACRLRYPS